MRGMIGVFLATAFFTAHPQPLVVAGCESEQHLKKAEQLIEQTRKENWDRTKWETECRKAGFEVVGSEQVVYLIPLYYTPAFADRMLIPLIEGLLKQQVPLARLEELEPHLQEALLALTYRPSISLQVIQQPSGERMRAMLSSGEILIGFLDTWDFKEGESGEILPILRSRRSQVYPRQALERFALTTPPPQPTPLPRPNRSELSLNRWHFLFSMPLRMQKQVEHMQAYLQWLQALQAQVAKTIPSATEQIWGLAYQEQVRPAEGTHYTEEDLVELAKEQKLEFLVRIDMLPQFAQKSWTFHQWKVGLSFVMRSPEGSGTIEAFIPLEVLLGLRDY